MIADVVLIVEGWASRAGTHNIAPLADLVTEFNRVVQITIHAI